jgi:hypothetical protein
MRLKKGDVVKITGVTFDWGEDTKIEILEDQKTENQGVISGKLIHMSEQAADYVKSTYKVGYIGQWNTNFLQLIEEAMFAESECECELVLLMNRGCQCGAFQNEI